RPAKYRRELAERCACENPGQQRGGHAEPQEETGPLRRAHSRASRYGCDATQGRVSDAVAAICASSSGVSRGASAAPSTSSSWPRLTARGSVTVTALN